MFLTLYPNLFWCLIAGFTAVQPTALVDLVGIRRFPRAQALYMIAFGTASLIATPLVGKMSEFGERIYSSPSQFLMRLNGRI